MPHSLLVLLSLILCFFILSHCSSLSALFERVIANDNVVRLKLIGHADIAPDIAVSRVPDSKAPASAGDVAILKRLEQYTRPNNVTYPI